MSNDSDLQLAVLAELNWEPSIVAAHIGVTARDGVVALSGHVSSFVQKHAALDAARRVKGVLAVAEALDVELPFDHQRDDEQIATAALDRLSWDVSVPRDAIQLVVEQGWVTMSGTVDWYFQKDAAEKAIRPLVGVVGISDQVLITPTLDTGDISDRISIALNRSGLLDPATIQVAAKAGDVTLSGTVRGWHDRMVAAETAWAAPGVTHVENAILVV